jgi:hypothetical protein
MNDAEHLKLFHMSETLLRADLQAIQEAYDLQLLPAEPNTFRYEDDPNYLQFPDAVRALAEEMSHHYRLFFCLENAIRDLVSVALEGASGAEWWEKSVPGPVKDNVKVNMKREQDAGLSTRSSEPIDYTNFGELSQIIDNNWDAFSDTFNSRRAVSRILASLNLLRAPIAHCAALAPDEVIRLQLALRDWYRLME